MSMNQKWRDASASRAEHIYLLLLYLYPRAHRQDYGQLMLQAFRDLLRDTSASGGHMGIGFWLEVLVDLAKSVWSEHWSALMEGLPMNWIWKHFGIFAGLVLGVTAIAVIVWTNVLFPNNESDSEYTTVYLLSYASLLLVFVAIGFLGSCSTNRILAGTWAGVIAALLGGAIAMATFFAVDNLFLSVVSQQVDKIQGFHQSSFPTMRDYINAGLVSGLPILLLALALAGAVCGTLGAAIRRLIPAFVLAR
jgi:hypothetical protein